MTEIEVPEGQETTLCIFLNIQAGKKKGSKQEKRTLGMRLQIAICVLAT